MARSRIWRILLILPGLLASGCAAERYFRILPSAPDYFLESPDSNRTLLAEVLDPWRDVTAGWVEVVPGMELRIERALFDSLTERTRETYIGSQRVRYRVERDGRLSEAGIDGLSSASTSGHTPLRELVPPFQQDLLHHRLFLQVVFNRPGREQGAILLSGSSSDELSSLTDALLGDPEDTCESETVSCTILPEDVTAAPDVAVIVNGSRDVVPWTTTLRRLAGDRRVTRFSRIHNGVRTRVLFDPNDPRALEVALLPGDEIGLE